MSLDSPGGAQYRVLVRGATAKDDAMTVRELGRAGIAAQACATAADMLAQLPAGAGALLLAEECLADASAAGLVQAVARQPPWSDLPVLIVARHGADSNVIADALSLGANVTVLERPIRVAALISAVRSALRGRRRQYELRDLLASLQESDQRKTEFLATLAHELRNPLAPIRSCVGILQRGAADPQPVLEVMDRQVHHMVRLVDDLLELSRITRGTVELRPEHVELATVFAAARDTSRPLVDAGGHDLRIRLPEEPIWLDADPVRLAQVLSNLLNNAARYTDPGGNIVMEARTEAGQAVITVTDDGMGLTREALAGVFDMFSQADVRDIRAQHGLGIGLALVRNLVEMHGGAVAARSDGPGKGSQFEVRLPLLAESKRAMAQRAASPRLAPASGAQAELAHAPERSGSTSQRKEDPALPAAQRILVVDDNRDAADSLAILLKLGGAEVAVAYDGPQALAALDDFNPRVAVLDLGMPGMSGLDVARHIRERFAADDCTLIALTGWGQESDRELTRNAGFEHHLTKPVDFDEIRAVLSAVH